MSKTGDIVKLFVNGAEMRAEVVKTYEDVDQKYVDVKVLEGGPNRDSLYQSVGPKPKDGVESSYHFEALPVAEQKEVRAELAAEAGVDDKVAPGGKVVEPAPDAAKK